MELDIIFFDAGGTILYPEPSVGEFYARAGRRFGIDVPADRLDAAFRAAFAEKKEESVPQGREWWQDAVKRTFARVGHPSPPKRMFEELYAAYSGPDAWRLFPGVPESLAALREKGYRTGLISNWDDRLPGILAGLGILGDLDPVVVSHRVGVEKPDPLIFQVALREAGVDPHRALMIGDDPEADVAGAAAVGMESLLIDWSGSDADALANLGVLVETLPPR